jgi:hypothetical protein
MLGIPYIKLKKFRAFKLKPVKPVNSQRPFFRKAGTTGDYK